MTKHATHESADEPTTSPHTLTLTEAATAVLQALHQVGLERLGHAYGCPAETNGPCTCGTRLLAESVVALEATLTPQNGG